jgi:bacillithiol biosynthesis deacetylase BshB1
MKNNILIFAAKPGDAEIAMGGTVAKLLSAGCTLTIIDLTDGGLNSKKTVEEKQFEISEANKILGIKHRENIGLREREINQSRELTKLLVSKIRENQPEIVFAPFDGESDFDSAELGRAVATAVKLAAEDEFTTFVDDNLQDAYQVQKLFYFFVESDGEPSFIIDVSESFDLKMDAVKAYISKFTKIEKPKAGEENSAKNFFEYLESKGKVFGYKINRNFGEPFYATEKLEFDIVGYLKSNEGIGWK